MIYRLLSRLPVAAGLGPDPNRVARVMALSFAGGTLLYARLDAFIGQVPLPVFAGLVYACASGLSVTLIGLFVPRMVRIVEVFAVARLGMATAGFLVPGFGAALIQSPLLLASTVALTALALERAPRACPAAAAP